MTCFPSLMAAMEPAVQALDSGLSAEYSEGI